MTMKKMNLYTHITPYLFVTTYQLFQKVMIVKNFKISEEVFDNCCLGPTNIFFRVVIAS